MSETDPHDDRTYPDRPFVGVGVVVLRGGEVLLIQRGKPPSVGRWSLPGGAQELGESVHETAIREVREETGVEISVIGLIDGGMSKKKVSMGFAGEGRPLRPTKDGVRESRNRRVEIVFN